MFSEIMCISVYVNLKTHLWNNFEVEFKKDFKNKSLQLKLKKTFNLNFSKE